MQLETIAIDKIQPAKYNPRKDLKPGDAEYEKLKKSIKEFGFIEPLVMNKRGNVLIGGHQRLKILKELGYTDVDVSVVDLPPAKEKALNIALNKISGEWDFPLLKDLLQEIGNSDLIDIEITGFDLKEYTDMLTQFAIPEDNKPIDEDAMKDTKNECPKCGFQW
jgi:ParB-like chromosome segregation protein Spo0J